MVKSRVKGPSSQAAKPVTPCGHAGQSKALPFRGAALNCLSLVTATINKKVGRRVLTARPRAMNPEGRSAGEMPCTTSSVAERNMVPWSFFRSATPPEGPPAAALTRVASAPHQCHGSMGRWAWTLEKMGRLRTASVPDTFLDSLVPVSTVAPRLLSGEERRGGLRQGEVKVDEVSLAGA
jgi:hypothetical protein